MDLKNLKFSWNNIKGTTLISIVVHLVLLLLFFLFQISTKLDIPEFVEVSFARGNVAKAAVRPKPMTRQPEQPKPTRPVEETKQEETTIKEKIQLPQRRMLEDDPPDLNIKKGEKKLPTTQIPTQTPNRATKNPTRDRFIPEGERGQKEVIDPGQLSQTDKIIPDASKSGKPGLAQSFEIEGKAAERKILNKNLPSYPEGYGKEGTIRIRFTILPNGMVGEMIPVLKTDAVLEQNAMTALKKWRFNPIPQSAPQETVEGIITFRYKLK